jgi:enoyl-CoA hydratase/carnithine racemase
MERLTEASPTNVECKPLIFTGNEEYFSVGADLNEIVRLSSTDALEFARCGQRLMSLIDDFPAPICAAVSGYCMGGGLDLALACDFRLCAANAIFGHRGAALGLITGWGGTQRLPNLIGRAGALDVLVRAEKLEARDALAIGLVSEIAADPLARSLDLIRLNLAPKSKAGLTSTFSSR